MSILTGLSLYYDGLIDSIPAVVTISVVIPFMSYVFYFRDLQRVFSGVSWFHVLLNIRSHVLLYDDNINYMYLKTWCENNCNNEIFFFKSNIIAIIKDEDGNVDIKKLGSGIIFSSKDDFLAI